MPEKNGEHGYQKAGYAEYQPNIIDYFVQMLSLIHIYKYGKEVADNTSILYGGSCKPSNAKELFANPDVDGGLIGGAALKVVDILILGDYSLVVSFVFSAPFMR